MTNYVDMIVSFEGFDPNPYWDHAQWSIGYGSYAGSRNQNQRPNIGPISQAEGRAMLRNQLGSYERNVDSYNSRYNWTPNERAALISFAYNIGSINQLTANGTRSKAEIARAMLLYNKASGQVSPGLVRRRNAEQALFLGGSPDLPPAGTVGVSGSDSPLDGGVTGATATGVANVTDDFAAANNTADLWQIAENSGNFWDNELDIYDYYTYTLEFFIVDELATINFMTDGYDLDAVANDGWPGIETRRITIAMTGGSTEFNVQDLNVESLGTGSQSGSRKSGTATKLNFNIIQVGNTSLNDSLQNAAVLMGFTSIHDATWYMKVNLIGYENNQPKKLQATKILPFKISDFGDLQTGTDARGTSTILNGTIVLQKSFDSDINTVRYSLEFDIKDTLRETIQEFFDKLNEKIEENNFAGDAKFVNSYQFVTDPTIEQYMSSPMNGPNSNLSSASNRVGTTSGALNIAQQIGTVAPGSNIFNIVADLCNQSLMIREAMTEQSDSFSDIVSITPVSVPNPGGLNILTNTRGHEVTYYLGIRRVVLFQNQIDATVKAQNSAKMVDEIFTQGRCRKRYYYQYTGLNDQILDFQVSLNKQLTKTYVSPTDEFAFANFVSGTGQGPLSIDALNQDARAALSSVQTDQDTFSIQLDDARGSLESINDEVARLGRSLQQEFIDQLNTTNIQPGMGDESVDSFFSDPDSFRATLADIQNFSEGDLGVITPEVRQQIESLRERQAAAEAAVSSVSGRLSSLQAREDEILRQGFGAILSDQTREALGRGSDNFDLISPEVRGDNSFVLIEALESDFVANLRNEEFNALIQTLINSPMIFERTILTRLRDVNRTGVYRSSDQNDIEVARQRYYEGLQSDISMQQLSITIKGDPFWLNNYIPPDKASEYFGNNGTNETYINENVNYSGFQYCMIINNKAAGTDELMNIKIANLMIDVYLVRSITSSFSGGTFTQTLNMVKKNFPTDFRALNPTIDATFIEEETLDAFGGTGGDGNSLVDLPGVNILADGDGEGTSDLIGVPEGAGTGPVQDGEGTGGGTTSSRPVIDLDAAYPAAAGALRNAVTSAFNGVDVPNREGATQLAYAMNQMKNLCAAGSQAACVDVSLAEQDILRLAQDITVEEYNEVAMEDPDYLITPEGIAVINQARIGQGLEPLNVDNIIGLDAEQVRAFEEQVEQDMQRSYVGTDDIISDSTSPMISLDPGSPAGAFAQQNADTLLNSDDPFDPRSAEFNSYGSRTGMPDRSISTEIPPNTLTPSELERAVRLQDELRAMVSETPLMDMSDTEYARAKQLESALEGIVDNATTGTRGEIRDEIIQREKRSELASAQEQLSQVEDDLDGYYWTTRGREEDEARREELRQQVLISQTENAPQVMDRVQTIVNPETGEKELQTIYTPTSISERPVIVPKIEPLPTPHIDNGDGTITIEGPPTPPTVVPDDSLAAIDATSLSEEQKQEYFDALASNNGIKVNQFIESLPEEQRNEVLQLSETQDLVILPGSVADRTVLPSGSELNRVSDEQLRQLQGAQQVYDNIANQVRSLPLKTVSFTYPDGSVDTWEEADISYLQPITYVAGDGTVKTLNPLETSAFNNGMGWTVGNAEQLMVHIAQDFDKISVGDTSSSDTAGRIRLSRGYFAINNQEDDE